MELSTLQRQAMQDTRAWFPAMTNDLPFMVLALCGEAGEVANLVKKIERGSHTRQELDAALREEVVDVLIYLLIIADTLDLDLEAGYRIKRAINEKRFGNGG